MACSSRDTIETAARKGVGALCFAFADPAEAETWVDTYYETFKEECVPIGRAVNPNVAMVTGFSCHEDQAVAEERGEEGFAFFRYALGHYAAFGTHVPGETSIWKEFQDAGGAEMFDDGDDSAAIGTPDHVREHLRGFEEAGVDQVIFLQQGGNNDHAHICDSLELFAEEVMPAFHERDAEHVRQKREELEPYVEAAMDRKEWLAEPDVTDRPQIEPLEGTSDLTESATGEGDD